MFAVNSPQTIRRAYQEIREGDDPWVAVGDFSHDWFGNYALPEQRAMLVADPIEVTEDATLEQRQWAAFCAASVEYLCAQSGMAIPAWVYNSKYVLAEEDAFYTSPLAYKARVRERLQHEVPAAFKRRNVFCSERVYANKYEIVTLTPVAIS